MWAALPEGAGLGIAGSRGRLFEGWQRCLAEAEIRVNLKLML